jgi:hypothetical protein
MFEVIVLFCQNVESFILDPPPGTSASHKLKDIVLTAGQVSNPDKVLRLPRLAIFFSGLDKGNFFPLVSLVQSCIINHTKAMRYMRLFFFCYSQICNITTNNLYHFFLGGPILQMIMKIQV